MKILEDFLRPTQKQLFKRLCKKFKGKTLINKGNFILVRGIVPVMLVAHLDTVHDEPVREICKTADGNILMSPQGIGGDDRCGCFALVKIYKSAQVKPWLLFTCDEEIGGIGAKAFCLAHKQNQLPKELDLLKFIVEIDRRGANDAVFYHCANTDFEAYITGKDFNTARGSFSDISLVAPELGIAAVNLSSGYHNAHTLHEFINRKELDGTIGKVVDIINDAAKLPRFEYIEHIQPISEPCKLIRRDDSIYLPCRVPADLRDIYELLLDFYSVNELESFRAEFGDCILWQIYNDEVAPFYFR
ncbi:MAG: hypothetical protein SR2Q5_04440 [Quinella sp. 2Q5]|nr:hypothetical protein [Quinella sp. 2Q5]